MTQIHWTNPVTGGFATAADWSTDTVPGPGDDAILDAPGSTPYTVNAWASETVDSLQTAKTATLAVEAGTFTASVGSGAGTNAGTISVANGAAFAFAGNIANSGVISLGSTGGRSELLVDAGGGTISGGAVTLSDKAGNEIVGTLGTVSGHAVVSTLVNRADISGAGYIGGNLELVNGKVIDATGENPLVIEAGNLAVAGSDTVHNNGTLEATNPNSLLGTGGLRLTDVVVEDAASAGVIEADGAVTTVGLTSATIDGGSLVTLNGGIIQTLDSGSTLNGVALNGAVQVNAGDTLTLAGAIDNSGQFDLASGGVLTGSNGTLTGGGQIVVNNGTASLAGALTVIGVQQIGGAGILQVTGTLDNQGTIGIASALSLAGTLNNSGALDVTPTGTITIAGGDLVSEAGGVVSETAGSSLILQGGTLTGGSFDGVEIEGGLYNDGKPKNLIEASTTPVVLQRGLTLTSGSEVLLEGAIDDEGLISAMGYLTVPGGAEGATLTGAGSIQVTSSGDIEGTLYGEHDDAWTPSVLVNDITIAGKGQIGSNLKLVNNGAVDGNGPTILDLYPRFREATIPGSNVIVNTGILEATNPHKYTNPGGLQIEEAVIDNSSGKGLIQAAGANVWLRSDTVEGGGMSATAGNEIIAWYCTFNGYSHAVGITGQIWDDSLTIEGMIRNSGTISVNPSWPLTIGPVTTLSGEGTILLSGGQIAAGAPGSKGVAPSLTNSGNTISGAGSIIVELINGASGLIEANNAAAALTINTGTTAVTNYGVLEADGTGGLILDSAVMGAGSAVIAAGTLTCDGAFSQHVAFTGTSGEIILAQSKGYAATISGFSTSGGTSLDLEDIGFVSTSQASFSGTATGGVLTVSDGTNTARIHLSGNYLDSAFIASSDGHDGVIIVDPSKAGAVTHFASAMAGVGGEASALVPHSPSDSHVGQRPILAAPRFASLA